jgi:hypothetical protein
MITFEHNLKFVTEMKEDHPHTIQLLNMDEDLRTELLESILREMLAPVIQPAIDELNAGGSYATLKVVA